MSFMTLKMFLLAIGLLFSSQSYAAGEKFCHGLFTSQNDTSLRLSGTVFSPAGNLLPTTNTLSLTTWNGKDSWKVSTTALRDYEEDYVGFLVSPDYARKYEVAKNDLDGLQEFSKSFTRRSTAE